MRRANIDKNQPVIVAMLRKVSAHVQHLHAVTVEIEMNSEDVSQLPKIDMRNRFSDLRREHAEVGKATKTVRI